MICFGLGVASNRQQEDHRTLICLHHFATSPHNPSTFLSSLRIPSPCNIDDGSANAVCPIALVDSMARCRKTNLPSYPSFHHFRFGVRLQRKKQRRVSRLRPTALSGRARRVLLPTPSTTMETFVQPHQSQILTPIDLKIWR